MRILVTIDGLVAETAHLTKLISYILVYSLQGPFYKYSSTCDQ